MGGRSGYQTAQEQGCATDARRKGIWRSIGDKTLAPLAHLQKAMALPLGEGDITSVMSAFTAQAMEATAALPLGGLQQAPRERINHWAWVAAELPHEDNKPLHSRLVEAINRGPVRHSTPLEVLRLVHQGQEVTGIVAYDNAFRRKVPAPPQPLLLPRLYGVQAHNEATIIAKLRIQRDVRAFWPVSGKEAAQGFGSLHSRRPRWVRLHMCSTIALWWNRSSGTATDGRTNSARVMMTQHVE